MKVDTGLPCEVLEDGDAAVRLIRVGVCSVNFSRSRGVYDTVLRELREDTNEDSGLPGVDTTEGRGDCRVCDVVLGRTVVRGRVELVPIVRRILIASFMTSKKREGNTTTSSELASNQERGRVQESTREAASERQGEEEGSKKGRGAK